TKPTIENSVRNVVETICIWAPVVGACSTGGASVAITSDDRPVSTLGQSERGDRADVLRRRGLARSHRGEDSEAAGRDRNELPAAAAFVGNGNRHGVPLHILGPELFAGRRVERAESLVV